MRKTKLIFALTTSALLVSCGASGTSSSELSSVVSSSSSVYNPSDVSMLMKKHMPYYELEDTVGFLTGEFVQAGTQDFYFVNHSSIPYVDVNEFINGLASKQSVGGDTDLVVTAVENNLTITNPLNDTSLCLDFLARRATYHGFENFSTRTKEFAEPFGELVNGGELFLNDLTTYNYYQVNEAYSIDLSQYNVKLYRWGKNYYVPFATMINLLGGSYLNQLIYTGNGLYKFLTAVDDSTLDFNKKILAAGMSWADAEYMEYSYDNIALFIDHYFGLDERESRIDGSSIQYFKDGAYAALAPYKERLLSTEADVSNNALCEFFAKELDDGGHSGYSASDLFGTELFEKLRGEETKYAFKLMDEIAAAREEEGYDVKSVTGDATNNGYYLERGNIAYIQFDSFVLYGGSYKNLEVTDDNYGKDSVTLFRYANQRIKANPEITDVVIDVSNNGGGYVVAGQYIASWACGGITDVVRNAKTKNMIEMNIKSDVNFDGVFDENDYLSPDINLYVMVSSSSFSCGNKLPVNIQDNRKKNTYFIGSQSGGGSCAVGESATNFLGANGRFSSDLQFGRVGSTPEQYLSNENGVKADFYTIDEVNHAADFADLDTIFAKINAKA